VKIHAQAAPHTAAWHTPHAHALYCLPYACHLLRTARLPPAGMTVCRRAWVNSCAERCTDHADRRWRALFTAPCRTLPARCYTCALHRARALCLVYHHLHHCRAQHRNATTTLPHPQRLATTPRAPRHTQGGWSAPATYRLPATRCTCTHLPLPRAPHLHAACLCLRLPCAATPRTRVDRLVVILFVEHCWCVGL